MNTARTSARETRRSAPPQPAVMAGYAEHREEEQRQPRRDATTGNGAIAVGEVRSRDVLKVAWRECRVGFVLGAMLATVALLVGTLIVDFTVAASVAVSLVVVCAWAATIGSVMPLLAKRVGIDPAVISAPLVTTLVDATGLIIYFLVAQFVFGL